MPQHDEPVLVPAPPLPPGPRHALVIATARYDDPKLRQLRSPVRDAEDFAAVLADSAIGGFTVTTLVDQAEVRIRRTIAAFLHQRTAEETVLIYLSCHGIQDRHGRLLFAATDTETKLPHASAFRAAELLDELDECKARRQILILDCCFSGSFGDKSGGSAGPALEQHLKGHSRGREVLTASRGFEYSYEGKPLGGVTPCSVFTTGLVEGLRAGAADRDRTGHITVEEAYDYAFNHVQRDGSPQTPQRWLLSGEGQKIVLARSSAGRAVTPAPLPAELRELRESRFPDIRIGAVNVIAEWLTDPDPTRALAARRALEEIAENDIRRVAEVATAHQQRVRLPAAVAPARLVRHAWRSDSGDSALRTPQAPAAILEGHAGRINGVAFSPDGVLLVSAGQDSKVMFWDVVSGERVRVLKGAPHISRVWGVAFSPDGARLVSAGGDGLALIWDVASGELVRVLGEHIGGINGVAFRPDGVLLASAGGECRGVLVWDVVSGERVRVLGGRMGWFRGVAFSPDGARLVSAGADGVVLVWDVVSGQRVRALEGHTGRVLGVAFSPDGVLLVSAGEDRTVRVWDAASGERVRVLEGGPGEVWCLAFNPVKPLLATAGADGTIRLWK